jgi:hypothetical protein
MLHGQKGAVVAISPFAMTDAIVDANFNPGSTNMTPNKHRPRRQLIDTPTLSAIADEPLSISVTRIA